MSTLRRFNTRKNGKRFGLRSTAGLFLLLAATGLIWAATASQAANPPCPLVGNFEIDGDMLQGTCAPPGDDWNTSGLNVQTSTQGGTYNTNNKDADPTSGWTSGGGTPDKADFQRAYSFARVVNGHYIVYLAWERTATSGTQSYNIELDNSDANVAADGTPQPNRSNGGAVFYIDAMGGGLPTFGSDCTFTSQSDYGSTCSNSQAGYTAAFNSAAITDPLNGNASVAAGGFDEIALDVTALTGIAPSCPGPSAASLYLRSATGTNHKNLKGYMAPFVLQPDSTCVPPPISTTATNGDNNVPSGLLNARGSTQFDTVTVGTAQAPGVGSVKFFLCTPANLTANGDCATGGVQVGSAKTLDLNGRASSDNVTGATTPNDNTDGKYCWRAEFTPGANDHHYLAGSDSNGDSSGVVGAECFTIVHKSPTIATQIALTGQNEPGLGFTSLGDTATLSGYAGNTDGETITFNLYGPFGNGVTPVCDAGHLIAAATTTGTLSGGSATTSQTYKPTTAGTYVWIASYNGDSFNDGISGTCSDANESATIVAAQIDVAKSANPPGPVSAGSTIGFDLTVTNDGSVPATGVHVHDVLPAGADGGAGGDLSWQLDPPYTGCSISGAAGSQVLDCNFTQVDGPGSLPVIHIDSSTTPQDCGTVKNKASITTTNGTGTDSDVAAVTVLCPALTIDKTADAPSVTVGSPIGFTVTASNNGQGTATGVLIDDPLPTGPGISWSIDNAGTSGPLTCGISSAHLTCTGSLTAGATEIVHVMSPTVWNDDHNSCGEYDNTAQVSATNVLDSPSDDASTNVLCADLHITKTHDAASVNAGSDIGFTITASNTGQGSATGALVNDPLPPGVTWSIDGANTSGPLTCGISSGTLTCTGTLAAGATEVVHITAHTSFSQCGEYDNTATLTATNTPQHPTDNASTTVNCADVGVSKTADAASVSVGSDIGFTVTVTNHGAGAALGVDVEDPLPAGQGVNWSIDNSSGPLTCSIVGSPPSETLTCTGDLAASGDAGDSQTVHITSHTVWNSDLNSCGEYDNAATLTWANGPQTPVSSNLATETVLCPDVTVTKTADHATVNAGEDVGFTITVSNGGPGTATGVTLHDPLPAGTASDWKIDPDYSGPGTCAITGLSGNQVLDCSFGALAEGDGASIHIVAGTSFEDCATYDNTATAHSTNEPGIPPASDTTTCLAPDLSVTKTADQVTVDAGDDIGFTIAVSNAGPGTAKNVVLDDKPLPAGSGAGVTWSIDSGPTGDVTPACAISGAVGSQELKCDPVDLASGKGFSLHITAKKSVAECTRYDNTAIATADNAPAAQDTAHIACNAPLLSVTKTADHATVNAGDDIGFTISVSNVGQGTAKNVTLDDPLPAGSGAGATWSIDSGPTGDVTPTCAITGAVGSQELTCDPVDLASGKGFSLHVTAKTSFDECTEYDNKASATSDNTPEAHDSADITCQKPALSLTKTADAASVDAGDAIGFTITVSNAGPGTAKNVTLDDPLPAGSGAGVTWSIDSGPTGDETPNCAVSNGTPQDLTCSPVDLGSGESYTLHVTATTSFTECTEYDNTATASADNAPDASDSADITCKPSQISITKTADHSAPVHAGDQIGFTVEVKNSGTGAAHGVVLKDPLPAGSGSGVTWTIDQSTGTPGQFALSGAAGSQTLSLASSTLPAGADYKVHVVAQTSQTECGVYDNTATLTTTNANNPGPASASESCAFRVDLSVTKAGSPATQDLGAGNITWTIAVTNNGPDTDTGVTIADPMPGGNTFVSATSSQGTCTGGAVLNCNIGTMAAGATVTITLVTTPSAAGDQTNTVTVAGDRPETNTTNNQATATVQITAPFVPPPVYCVAVSKITPNQLFVGRKTTLTIHLSKHGKAASGVKVLIKGPKLHVTTKRSNARGIVKQVIKMKKAGIDTFTPLASKRCNTKRVGVTGVFTPPVTG